MTAHAPASAAECIVAKQMLGPVRDALSDLFSAGIAAEALHTLAASVAIEEGRLDRQIVACFAGLAHGNGNHLFGAH